MAFEPIRTERLLIRPVRLDDAEPLAERRSDPAVAEYQNWSGEFSVDRARGLIEDVLAHEEPPDGGWWMLTIADHGGHVVGDLALHPTWDRRCVEIGYTLARPAWGNGYAVEAVEALVARLWQWPGVTRVHAMLHPDNVASAQVLERTGFVFEGRTRLSYWVGDENSDDSLYGMTRSDWQEWVGRPRQRPGVVRLVEITIENQRAVESAVTHHSQRRFVADVRESLSDALVRQHRTDAPSVPWYRAIEADGEVVGFVMVAVPRRIDDSAPEPYLWRLLVDRCHQRRGIGSMAIDLVVNHVRALGAGALTVSWAEGRGSPAPLYVAKGFVPTGEIHDDEVEGRLRIE